VILFFDECFVSILQEVKLRTTFTKCGLLSCLILLAPIAKPSQAENLVLDSLIAQALRANPDLAAARLRYRAFEAKVPQAGSLPDPMLKVTVSNLPTDTWDLDRTPMSGIELMLTQTIPFPGKLGLKKNAARNLAGMAEKEFESARDYVTAELKRNYYQLCWLEKSVEITRNNKRLLDDFADIASTRYSVGEGLQQDVLKARVEISRMTDRLISLEEMGKTVGARINVLLDRDPQASLGEPGELSLPETAYSEEELQNMAVGSNLALRGMDFSVRAKESSYRLSRRQYLPDLTLSVGYRIRDEVNMDPVRGVDFFSASVGISVPLYFWSKQKKNVKEKRLDWESAGQKYRSMENDTKLAISRLFYSLVRYGEEAQLYSTAILPQARQSLESARSAYQVGKVDFLTLLNSQTTLYNYEIAYHQALSSYYMTMADMEQIVGASLPKEGE
jgi:cobalt-zinc-cadmium efflux system outer membrane protein